MSKKKEKHVELRFYEIPKNEYVLALLGESWRRVYHNPVDDLHFHNLLEIGYCHEGSGEILLDTGSVEKYRTGSFTVIPINIPHSTWSDGEGTNYWEFLYIDADTFLSEMYGSDQGFARELTARVNKRAHILHETENPALAGTIRAILEEKRTPKEYEGEVEKCLVQKLLLEIARVNPLEARKNDQPLKLKKAMIHSLAYVDEHYAETIKIETLAEVSHLSETHFRRVFENIMHMMPVDYINFIRIQKACEYLKNSNDSIENIAIKVGYVSLSTFHRNFRKFVGASPYKWKNAAENAKTKLFNYKITALKGW